MAAEVLGIAYSGFAIAGAGSGFGKTAITIKQLRDAVQDAPEQMQWLSDQLCVLQPLVADLETLLINNPISNTGSSTSVPCVQLYNKAMQNLSGLADDLKADLTASHWSKRLKAKVKIAMKQDRIRMYQERLSTTVQILMFCYQNYTTSLMLSQHLISVEPVAQQESDSSSFRTKGNVEYPHGCMESSEKSTFWDTASQLSWLRPGIFARFRFKTRTIASGTRSYDVSHLQLQLPFWLSSSMWDVYIRRACFGWKVALRPITIRDFDGELYETITTGTSSDLFKIITEQGRSIHDRNMTGETALHFAIESGNYETAIDLILAGARLDEGNRFGLTPFVMLCIPQSKRTGRLEIFQDLLRLGILEDLADAPCSPRLMTNWGGAMYCWNYALNWAMWSTVALFDLVVAVSPNYVRKAWWEKIPWWYVEPSMILELLQKRNFHESEEFRVIFMNAAPNHIHSFIEAYFWQFRRHLDIPHDARYSKEWRQLCRILLYHVPLATLSLKTSESDYTPLLSGLRFYCHSHESLRTLRRSTERSLKCWLEDLQAIDKDLEAYGRSEASMLAYRPRQETSISVRGGAPAFSPRIHFLEYGPNPEDWKVHWDYFQPEYAREFWQCIETKSPQMPGAWVDD